MAADEEKTTVEVGDETATEGEGKKKEMNKLVLFGGIGGVVVIIGVVLALFVLKPMMSDSTEGDAEQTTTEETEKAKKQEEAKKKKKKVRKDAHGESESVVYAVKDIVINPAGTGGTRFLSVSFGFELESSWLAQEFEDRESLVRDALITILASKTVAQLTDVKQKEIIRYQVKKRLSKLLDTEEIAGVYYTDFVLQ